jgi:hypothetical protein
MADKKITALNENTTGLSTDDLFHVVDSPQSSPSNKKITANTVFQKVPSWIGYAGTGIQSISNAGGTTVTTAIAGGVIEYTATGGSGNAIHTLPNGVDGQTLTVTLIVTAGALTVITPATALGFTSLTLTLVGDAATLLYTGATGWVCTGASSGIAGTSADMLT